MNRTNEEEVPSVLTSATENATQFDTNDASYDNQPEKYKGLKVPKWDRFSRYNRGTWNGPKRENKKITRRQDNHAIYDALAGQLELTDHQKSKGRRILENLDLPNIGKPVRLIAFSVCVLVANDDVYNGYRYWPKATTNDEDFERIERDLDYDPDTILSAMMNVQGRRCDEGADR